MRDLTHDDKMLIGGRYGYVADPTRFAERSITQQFAFGSGYPAPSSDFNQQWSGMNGVLANGQCNALDGHLGVDGTDHLNRDRYGKGTSLRRQLPKTVPTHTTIRIGGGERTV